MHAGKPFCGTLEGDNANDEDPNEILVENTAWTRSYGESLSEARSISQDSDFQKAIRMYMSKGHQYGGRQKRSSHRSSEESDFQDLIRKTFNLRKAGEGRKAHSA